MPRVSASRPRWSASNGEIDLPDVMSRKKQVAPKLPAAI
jgi:hypothetical protein